MQWIQVDIWERANDSYSVYTYTYMWICAYRYNIWYTQGAKAKRKKNNFICHTYYVREELFSNDFSAGVYAGAVREKE